MKITVIGGANVDITGSSISPLLMRDSNSAHVHIGAGGVGRNIAENLVRLGAEVTFITALGGDSFAKLLRGYITEAGLDDSRVIVRPNMNTGTYLALLEPAGELFVAVNDMEAVESIAPADIEAIRDVITGADLVIVDANLMPNTLAAIVQAADTVPIMADTVSVSKVRRLQAILPHLEILKANRAEAAALAGFPLDTEDALQAGCRALLDAGMRQVYITLGELGACFASADGFGMQPVIALRCPSEPSKLVNVNGAGDAFAAGVAFSYCQWRLNTATHARMGAACAAVTIESNDAVCKTLSREQILRMQ
jgi:pseudouridine kinase